MSEKIQLLQKELHEASRKNRDLADANKDTSREYSKLRAQYAHTMGKNVASNAGYTVKGLQGLELTEQASGPIGSHHIGVSQHIRFLIMKSVAAKILQFLEATPNRAFHVGGENPGSTGSTNSRRTLPVNAPQPSFVAPPSYASANIGNGSIHSSRTRSITSKSERAPLLLQSRSVQPGVENPTISHRIKPAGLGPYSGISAQYQHPAPAALPQRLAKRSASALGKRDTLTSRGECQ